MNKKLTKATVLTAVTIMISSLAKNKIRKIIEDNNIVVAKRQFDNFFDNNEVITVQYSDVEDVQENKNKIIKFNLSIKDSKYNIGNKISN